LLAALVAPAAAQERGAAALGQLVAGLGVNTRVLMIGAHPDDEDTNLITWLQRGRHVETAYLSLTRGDGGQNIIGNELGEALGVIRTEELLAARRIDGARQYFTRAFDFGFSKDTVDTYKHWTRDSILGDVVRVVRAFRPHVIVAVFSGTTRDGHGHHQVSGLLARAAYDVAGDTMAFPVASYGAPWTSPKFYRAARGNQQNGTLGMDVGEYSPLLGRSFGEIAGESRSQHKSQGFGALQRKGPIMNYVRREASRVNEGTAASAERSLFDGIDTSWARFSTARPEPGFMKSLLDSMVVAFAAVRRAYDPFAPERLRAPLSRAMLFVRSLCPPTAGNPCERIDRDASGIRRTVLNPDLAISAGIARARVQEALRAATGVQLEARSFENWALGRETPVITSLYNFGRDTIAVSGGMVSGMRPGVSLTRYLEPGGVLHDTLSGKVDSIAQPWWLMGGRTHGMFLRPGSAVPANGSASYPMAWYTVDLGGRSIGEEVTVGAPVEMPVVDQVRGELRRTAGGVPLVSVTLDHSIQYVPANGPVDRIVQVHVRSGSGDSSTAIRVSLVLPAGLVADSATRVVRLEGWAGGHATVAFRVRGRLAAGQHRVDAKAEVDGRAYSTGYDLIDYDHISRQRVYRPASIRLSVVDVALPSTLRVAYIAGVGDNVAPALSQLGISTNVIAAADVARADLSSYTTVVIGPRAYDAYPTLRAANPRLFDFARKGGTLVVQYGQYEMTEPGATPYPITINRPHDRVTHEDAPVTIDAPGARELTFPNRITAADFNGWVQERGLYMPRTFDPAYRSLLSMSDPNEPANKGALLIAPLGEGLYIYTSLSFFRQLPAGVPGAARLFVNLLSAKLAPPGATP
jgi:LmbE family N-acetylglucosaminyl deacetylase